jgi:site-specific recombinase XerD
MICAATLTGFLESTFLVENFDLSKGYVSELRRVVRQLNAHAGYEVSLAELSPAIVSRFLASMLATASPVTVNNKRRMLLTIWRAAYRANVSPRPAAKRIKKMLEPTPIPTAWTPEECGRIFAACQTLKGTVGGVPRSQWWLSLFLAIYSTGERINAVIHAKTMDCDLSAGTLLLRWQTVKTRKNRLVWLQPEAVNAIRSIHDPIRDRLWNWPHGKRHFFRWARRIIESAKVPCPKNEGKNLFQKLRRTSGSLVEAHGGDGARHLGNTRKVFDKHYRSASICGGSQVSLLPSPRF